MRYDAGFREEATLRDGTVVVVRGVVPEDRELLRRGFDQLSRESRYRRFFANRLSLSDQELRYLTEVDGEDHYAIGATMIGADGVEEGVGIARFVRDREDAEVAEPAVAVVDRYQNKGLGTLLLEHLTAAAYERGIRRFHCDCLASNEPIKHVLRDLSTEVRFSERGEGVLEVTMPLPEPRVEAPEGPPSLRGNGLHRLLSKVAAQMVNVQLGRRLLAHLRGESQEG